MTLTELAPCPYISITNVYLEDSNMFARFDEIPSLSVENIKKKPKRRMDGRIKWKQYTPTNTVCRGYNNGTCVGPIAQSIERLF